MRSPTPPQARANAAKSIGWRSQPYSGLPRNTICSHLICPSVSFLTTTTLIGELVLDGRREFGHEHREAAVPDEGDDLAVGIGELRGDGVGQPVGHGREIARRANASGPRRAGMCRAAPGGDRAASRRRRWRRRRSRLPSSRATTCGFIGRSGRVPRSSISCHQRPSRLRLLEEPAVARSGRATGAGAWSVRRAVADEPDLDRISEPDARGIDVDLDTARLAGLRVVLDVGKGGPDEEERVTVLERVLRRLGAEEPDAAGRVRAVVGYRGLPEQRLDNRRGQGLGQPLQLRSPAPSAPRPARIAILRPAFSSSAARRRSSSPGKPRAASEDVRGVAGDVARERAAAGGISCRSTGKFRCADAAVAERRAACEVGRRSRRARRP